MRCRSNAAVAAGAWLAAASLIAGCGGQATRSFHGAGAARGTAGSSGSAGSSSGGTGGGSGSSGCAGVVTFYDPAIDETVRAAVGIPEGPIEASALGNVTTLFTRGAASLGGVECLAALTTFRSVAVLRPLTGVTSLRELRVSGNDLTSLAPLSELADLEIVAVENNVIVDLTPLAGKPRLERVMISTLAGTVLPAPRCGSELDVTYNPITTGDLEYVCSQGWVTRWGTNPPQTCNAPCLQ